MDDKILGRWVQGADQDYPGLYFEFFVDGRFEARYEALAVVSAGTYETRGDEIDMDQTEHNFGLVGKFVGLYRIIGDQLEMHLVAEGDHERPGDLSHAVIYHRAVEQAES